LKDGVDGDGEVDALDRDGEGVAEHGNQREVYGCGEGGEGHDEAEKVGEVDAGGGGED